MSYPVLPNMLTFPKIFKTAFIVLEQLTALLSCLSLSQVKGHCQKGIPASVRAKGWPLLCGAKDRKVKGQDLYKVSDWPYSYPIFNILLYKSCVSSWTRLASSQSSRSSGMDRYHQKRHRQTIPLPRDVPVQRRTWVLYCLSLLVQCALQHHHSQD